MDGVSVSELTAHIVPLHRLWQKLYPRYLVSLDDVISECMPLLTGLPRGVKADRFMHFIRFYNPRLLWI